jgi:NAD(P)-dependent dehydrogenase (short-subunit alcohol dehydrogenase family)
MVSATTAADFKLITNDSGFDLGATIPGQGRELKPEVWNRPPRLRIALPKHPREITMAQPETDGQFAKQADETAKAERRIQEGIDREEQRSFKGDQDEQPAMQAGAREYPAPPFPAQHQAKPGLEATLDPAPMYDAPFYKGSEKLKDKVALITGADSGIGRAVAVLFAREGCDVAMGYLSEDSDAQETKAAVEREGRRAILIPGDVADPAYARAAVEKTVAELGKLDVLVNNAAFQEHVPDFEDLTDEHFDRTLKTNLYGYFYLAKAAVPHMKPGSAIVMTGSITGIEGSKALLDYSMTKGGIHAFVRALSGHLVPKGIRVNAVAPGPVWTPLNPADKQADKVSEFGAKTQMKRPAQPEEIAPAYVFLASPHTSSYITGEILPIIGGYGGG